MLLVDSAPGLSVEEAEMEEVLAVEQVLFVGKARQDLVEDSEHQMRFLDY